MKIYVAGPFFNPVQKEHALKVAKHLKDEMHEYFAPVEHMFVTGGKESVETVFERNVQEMEECDMLLAQLDYPTPAQTYVKLITPIPANDKVITHPDTGTVWEMGYAACMELPVIGYTTKKLTAMNLMLVRGCRGIVSDVFKYIDSGFDPNLEIPWEGKVI